MTCNNCGLLNDKENKYCINCGEELTVDESSDLVNCSRCGFDNDPENIFCISCGNKLQHKTEKDYPHSYQHTKNRLQTIKAERNKNKHDIRKISKNNSKNIKTLWITTSVVIAAVLTITVLLPIFNKTPDKKEISFSQGVNEQKSNNPAIETKVYEIASKFVCSCGNCNEESLEICKCERAIEERQFIRNYLEQSDKRAQKQDEIVIEVANKYGWLKAQFASAYNVDPSRVWNPNLLTNQAGQLQPNKDFLLPTSDLFQPEADEPLAQKTKATISDKYTLYSAFNCPCGRCRIDELKDCNCDHPGGAKEIKRFVDEKISENKYTINEITDLINNKYGGKKI